MKPDRSPRVLHTHPLWLPQTQTWLYTQICEVEKLGIPTHVVCELLENADQFPISNLHCLAHEPSWRQVWDRTVRRLRLRRHLDFQVSVGRRCAANLVHSHFGHLAWMDLGAVRAIGARHVVTFYGFDVNKLPRREVWRARYRALFDAADLLLCEGSHMAQCLVDLGCPTTKLAVQHLGVNLEHFSFKPRSWRPGAPLRVMLTASFRQKKGIVYAVRALAELRRHLPVEFTIVGGAGADQESQAERTRIESALAETGMGQCTRLLGFLTQEETLLEAHRNHVFLHPSVTAADGDTEGGAPVCIIEMLATGMPVVSTRHCDIPEVVGPDLDHLLAPERDVQALAQRLRLVADHPERHGEWATLGRRRVEAEYDKDIQARRLVEHYCSVLAQ